jgi:hypothetical protein
MEDGLVNVIVASVPDIFEKVSETTCEGGFVHGSGMVKDA